MFSDLFTIAGRWGRLNRQRYFFFSLVQFLLTLPVFALPGYVAVLAIQGDMPMAVMYLLTTVAYAFAIWMNICLSVKRLHDLDKTGWMFLIFLVPLVNILFILYLLFAGGTAGENQYGPDPLQA